MTSSQSLMRWLSSVSWANFCEVAMKSSWGRSRGYHLCAGPTARLPHPL